MGFKFKHVPRSLISCVDVIAKTARVKRSNYVIRKRVDKKKEKVKTIWVNEGKKEENMGVGW